MAAYYQFIKREQQDDGVTVAYYKPTEHAQGAWNEHEQHMAPATGLLTAELTGYVPQANTRVARISLDILGLIPLDDFTITTLERAVAKDMPLESFETICQQAWQRGSRPVRLLGIGVRFIDEGEPGRAIQLDLFD